MTMTDEEIRRSYRLAKHPKRHIVELAQLNCCHREKIEDIVEGVVPWKEETVRRPHPTRGKTKIEINAIYAERSALFLEKYREGLNDGAIGRACDVSSCIVWHWRNRQKLPSNYKRRKGD